LPTSEEKKLEERVAQAKETVGRALATLRGAKYTSLQASISLESAVEERILEIEGGDNIPGELGSLDALLSSVESAVEVLKKNG
jgi:hypothetical protein